MADNVVPSDRKDRNFNIKQYLLKLEMHCVDGHLLLADFHRCFQTFAIQKVKNVKDHILVQIIDGFHGLFVVLLWLLIDFVDSTTSCFKFKLPFDKEFHNFVCLKTLFTFITCCVIDAIKLAIKKIKRH